MDVKKFYAQQKACIVSRLREIPQQSDDSELSDDNDNDEEYVPRPSDDDDSDPSREDSAAESVEDNSALQIASEQFQTLQLDVCSENNEQSTSSGVTRRTALKSTRTKK